MDLAIELAKCKEAAEKVCCTPSVVPVCSNGECASCDRGREYIATFLLEARADAVTRIAEHFRVNLIEDQWLNDLADQLQREVHARRQRGL